MSVRHTTFAVAITGAVTALFLVVGLDTIGGVLALFQLGLFVGAPLAVLLHEELRSWPVVVAISGALSIALSAISVQFLIWFKIASSELTVVTATAYGVILVLLLASSEFRSPEPGSRRVP